MPSSTMIPKAAVSPEITDLLHRALQQFDGPQSASKIVGQLPKASRPKPAGADELLQQEVAGGRLWQYPDVRKKPQFWIQSPVEFAQTCLRRELQSGPKSEKVVVTAVTKKKTLAALSAAQVQQLLSEMLRTGEAHICPPLVGVKQTKTTPRLISFFKPDPADYVKDALQKVSVTLGASIEEVLKSTIAFASRELQELALDKQQLNVPSAAPDVSASASQDERLLEAMRAINPRIDSGDMVDIATLRKELDAHMPGSDFDAAVLDAVYRRRFAIHRFDRPELISQEQRDQMLRDEEGHYHNTISLWRN